jgi:hypothetical protein
MTNQNNQNNNSQASTNNSGNKDFQNKLYSFLQEDRTEEEIRDFCDTNGKNAKQQSNQNS